MTFSFRSKWKLAYRVAPIVFSIVGAKLIVHFFGWEFLTLNSLFGALISANVFLIGFLISGVLADYKEAERLPGDLSCSIEALVDESSIILKNKKSKIANEFIKYIDTTVDEIISWLHKKQKTRTIMDRISGMNTFFLALEPLTQANFIVRMKNEQNTMRRLVTRIHSIRETSFNPAGYAIAEIISIILCIGLIFTKIDPYYESIFFVTFVTFILIYMVLLIKDLDNPFAYYEKDGYADEVSLYPLYELQRRINSLKM